MQSTTNVDQEGRCKGYHRDKGFGNSNAIPLNLAHRWSTLSDATSTAAHVNTRTTSLHSGEDGGDKEGGKAEPEEGSGGLSLVAALAGVWRAVGDRVGGGVSEVTAAVDVKVGSHGDSTAEVEDGVEGVKCDHDHWVNRKSLLDGGRDEVEEGQHREDGHEHVVVDDGWVTGERGSDHVTDEGHDEKSPEELKGAHGQVDH